MAVTRSWTATAPAVVAVEGGRAPRFEWVWLLFASLFVAAGLAMVYDAKTIMFAGADQLINLNTVNNPAELMPLLESFPDRADRAAAADKLYQFLESSRPLPNAGALSKVRRDRRPLLPLARLKPLTIVRTPREFRNEFLRWIGLYFAGFYLVALAWRMGRFRGDRSFLPALHLLTGVGLILMLSMRDPLRDTLEFHKFALGVFLGCLLLVLPALRPFHYQPFSA